MRNGVWTRTTIRRILRSPTINGQIVVWEKTAAKGRLRERVILGDDGMPLRREAVLDDDKWHKVIQALDAASRQWVNRHDAAPLLGVAFCGNCHKPLYGAHMTNKGRPYHYYRCAASCGARQIPMAYLGEAVDEDIVEGYGWVPRTERIVHPGDDHSREVAAVGQQIADLTAERFVRGVMRPDYDALMTQLQSEHTRLAALPAVPGQVEIRPTGMLVSDWWPTLDAEAKRRWLLDRGVKVLATRRPDGFVTVVIEGGELHGDIAALAGITPEEYAEINREQIAEMLRERGLPQDLT
jgi:hypothetical protein